MLSSFTNIRARHVLLALVVVLATLGGWPAQAGAGSPLHYVALGDSIAAGFGATTSYVEHYRAALSAESGRDVVLDIQAHVGWRSDELLAQLRDDQDVRASLRSAGVITWNIGGNDMRDARDAFKEGTCGGADGQDCLRATEAQLLANWNAIVHELLVLTAGRQVLLRTMDIYNPYVAPDTADGSFEAFKPYLDRVNAAFADSAYRHGIGFALVYRAFNGDRGTGDPATLGYIWIDGLHPSDSGHVAITDSLISLGFGQSPSPAADSFARTWQRPDRPVFDGAAARTWIWGPQAATWVIYEPYAESPGALRQVQYYDKSRMELTHPDAPYDPLWSVTNGLLVVELVTGRMQLGDNAFEQRTGADVNVAGDPDVSGAVTYAMLDPLRDDPPLSAGEMITQRALVVAPAGAEPVVEVTSDPATVQYGVVVAEFVPQTGHMVASVFWTFMTSEGLIYEDQQLVAGQLFENPFYATGFPITEAYWSRVQVAGTERDVLLQCFERRCLTYTPDNPEGWQVEAGNVGQHYFRWRYGSAP